MEETPTIISIETESLKVVKELYPQSYESYDTCDVVIREMLSLLVAAGWQPGSIREAVIDIAYEYENYEGII